MLLVKKLTKTINKKEILKEVNCEFKGVFGLVGPNGAGKSTLLRVLANVNQKYDGVIQRNQIKQIGYLPQDFNPYKNLKVEEILDHFSILKGIKNKSLRQKEIETVLKEVNLIEFRGYKTRELSGGMVRRLGIAQALLGNPDLLIVDEPFNGIDFEEKIRLKSLLKQLSFNSRRTIIITSHLVEELEEFCTDIGFLIKGRIVKYGELQSVFKEFEGNIWEVYNESNLVAAKMFSTILSETIIDNKTSRVRIYSDTHIENGIKVTPSIKDIYLYYVREAHNHENFSFN